MPAQEYLELLRSRAADLYAARPGQRAARHDRHAVGHQPGPHHRARTRPRCSCWRCAPTWPPSRSRWTCSPRHAGLLPEPLAAAAADQLAFSDVIAMLVDYSLAKRTPAGLQLHRLVQAAIRARARQHPPAHARPGRLMTRRLPAGPGRGGPLAVALGLLRADAPGRIMGAPQDWPRWAVLLPHVLAATGHRRAVARGQQARPAGQTPSWLLDRAATYLQVHARLAEARPLAERALAIAEAAYGPTTPTSAPA